MKEQEWAGQAFHVGRSLGFRSPATGYFDSCAYGQHSCV
jgi:hypothetical protein